MSARAHIRAELICPHWKRERFHLVTCFCFQHSGLQPWRRRGLVVPCRSRAIAELQFAGAGRPDHSAGHARRKSLGFCAGRKDRNRAASRWTSRYQVARQLSGACATGPGTLNSFDCPPTAHLDAVRADVWCVSLAFTCHGTQWMTYRPAQTNHALVPDISQSEIVVFSSTAWNHRSGGVGVFPFTPARFFVAKHNHRTHQFPKFFLRPLFPGYLSVPHLAEFQTRQLVFAGEFRFPYETPMSLFPVLRALTVTSPSGPKDPCPRDPRGGAIPA